MPKKHNFPTFKFLNFLIIILFFIFAISFFLRFYQIPLRFIFDIDTEYQVLLATTIIKDFHIIWIGVSASNIGYYLGPGLVYLTAFLLWITKDPVILGYFASFVGSITLVSIWFVSKKFFGEKISLIATTLYGFTPFIINYDRKFWPIFIPLVGIWMLYGLVKSQNNKWWLLLCIFLISISFHIHLSLMVFWPFIIYGFIQAKILTLKSSNILFILLNFILYFLITLPLLVFDFVHNFDNLLTPIRFIQHLGTEKISVHREFPWIYVLYLLCSIYLWVGTKSFTKKMIYGILIFISFAFIMYPGPMQEYYTVIIFPFITIALALFLYKLPRSLLIGGLFIFSGINIYNFITQPYPTGLNQKKIMIQHICPTIQNKPYYLEVGSKGRDYNGWYYLFTVYCKQPTKSDVDSMFGWIYGPIQSKDKLIKIKAPF